MTIKNLHNIPQKIIHRLLNDESMFRPSEDLLMQFLNLGVRRSFPAQSQVIPSGTIDTNVYMVIEGITRVGAFDGKKEITYAFGFSGSIYLSPNGHYGGKPSFYFWECCTKCEILTWSHEVFYQLIKESHEFTIWFFSLALNQYHVLEAKEEVFTGSASERFKNLFGKSWSEFLPAHPRRTEIALQVPSRVLASYLKITPAYLSNLKKEFHNNNKIVKEKAKKKSKESTDKEEKISSGENYKEKSGENFTLNKRVMPNHQEKEKRLVELKSLLKENSSLSSYKLSSLMGISSRTIKSYLSILQERGQIQRTGNNMKGQWIVIK